MKIVGISVNADLSEVLKVIEEEKYTRIPIYDKKIDNIIGILHVKDLLHLINNDKSTKDFVLKEYVRNLQNLIYTDSYELYETAFKANQIKVFRLIDKLFEAKSNSYKEVILKNIDLIESLQKLFYDDKDEVSQENQLDDFFN
jgi:putative hemolysin